METIFDLSGLLVLPFWLLMILAPRWRWARRVMASPLVCVPPALLYLMLVIPRVGEIVPAVLSPTLGGITALLGTPEGATIAWAHFLAFDLFAGRWAYLDALERGVSAWGLSPILFMTLMLGPIGFLAYLALRGFWTPRTGTMAERSDGTRRAREAVRGLAERQPVLVWTGVAHLALFVLFLALMPLDSRTVLGIDPWIKPSKFAVSIATYLLTIAIFVDHLALSRRAHRAVSWSLALAMGIEMVLISMQSARGTTSHFNRATAFDAAVFYVMGTVITYAACVAAYVLFKYFRSAPQIPPAYLWGIRLGLFIFLLANAEAFVMTTRLGHAVGVADGGPGLPYTNWSTEGGDLRIAHFIGIHALQAVPLAGLALTRLGASGRLRRPEVWLGGFAAVYGAVALLLFVQALAGQPLTRL